jgi:penicillin-binding protein 1B
VVWVGNDDYSDIKIEGAHAAAPIWAEFMKHAVALPQYSDTRDFVPPSGVVQVRLDKGTNLLADASCPDDYYAAFLDGTQPTDTCDHAGGDQRNIFQRIFGLGEKPSTPAQVPTTQAAPPPPAPTPSTPASNSATVQTQPSQEPEQTKKKRGFFSRIFGGKKDDTTEQRPQQQNPPAPPE